MDRMKTLLIFFLCYGFVAAQNSPCPSLDGVIAGCILGTLAFCLLVIAVTLLILYCCRKRKQRSSTTLEGNKGGALVNKDRESGHAYDNPVFKDETDGDDPVSNAEQGFAGYVQCKEYVRKNPHHAVTTEQAEKNNGHGVYARQRSSQHSLDGAPVKNGECMTVPLQSQDFIGLGFNIGGNMRDGIIVSQVNNKGPANDSGYIHQGDRILGVYISFEKIVYEDALTILSYASPYPVKIDLQKRAPSAQPGSRRASSQRASDASQTSELSNQGLSHPKYRSHSMDDLSKMESSERDTLHQVKSFSQEESPPQSNLHKFKNYSNLHDEIELDENLPLQEKQVSVSNLSQFSYPEVGDLNMDEYISPRKQSEDSTSFHLSQEPSSLPESYTEEIPRQTDSLCNFVPSETDIPSVHVEADVHHQVDPEMEDASFETPDIEKDSPELHSNLLSEVQAELPTIQVDETVVQMEQPEDEAELPKMEAEAPEFYSNPVGEVPVSQLEEAVVQLEQPQVEAELPEMETEAPSFYSSEEQADLPNVQMEEIVVQAEHPQVESELPEMEARMPRFHPGPPSEEQAELSTVQVEEVVVLAKHPLVEAELPGMETDTHRFHSSEDQADLPNVQVEEIVVQAEHPQVEAELPEMEAKMPWFEPGPPSEEQAEHPNVQMEEVVVQAGALEATVEPEMEAQQTDDDFEHSFNNLSDQDKLDVIRLSYEQPDITVETVAVDSNPSSRANSPESNHKTDLTINRPELGLEGKVDQNLQEPDADDAEKLQESVSPAFDVRLDEGRTNSHSSSHSNSPTREVDDEPETEVKVFAGVSSAPIIGGASGFMTDTQDLREYDNVDFLCEGPAQSDTGQVGPSSDVEEETILPQLHKRDKNFNSDFPLQKIEDNSTPHEKITIDMFPEEFEFPEISRKDVRESAVSPVSSVSEEIVQERREKNPLDINLDLDNATILLRQPIKEADILVETSEENHTSPGSLTSSENSDDPSVSSLDTNSNRKGGYDLQLSERQFEDLRNDLSPSGEFRAKPVLVIADEESPTSTPTNERSPSTTPTPPIENAVENHINSSPPDNEDVKMRPHSPRSKITHIRSSLNDARAKFFAEMASPEKEVKPFMPRNFEPLKLNGQSPGGSSDDTTPVSTPEKLNFPLDSVEMIHRQRRESGESTPTAPSPTNLRFGIEIEQTVEI